jgi:hypothetical protein
MHLRDELQNLISGVGGYSGKDLIQTAADYLRKSKETGRKPEKPEFFSKDQEEKELITWIESNNLWFRDYDESRFIARGAEQRVYLYTDERFVYKLNDSIFYEYWLDYFYSLLLHNFFFPATRYDLSGFFLEKGILYAVVKQPYIEITETTDTYRIKSFLNDNGFILKKNNDYSHPEAGIILEDLHDENVLTRNGVLFFIDTVFYLKDNFPDLINKD